MKIDYGKLREELQKQFPNSLPSAIQRIVEIVKGCEAPK